MHHYSLSKHHGFIRNLIRVDEYMNIQQDILCYRGNAGNLRAVLRNETLHPIVSKDFMYHLVENSKTDNGEAVSILLQDGGCDVDVAMLEKLLRKGYTAMAAVLQQNERVRIQRIRMCLTTCSTNIGCYECISWGNCENYEHWYCGDCTESDSSLICRSCDDYVCPDCVEDHENRFHSCKECGIIECDDCTSLLYYCHMCIRWKCTSCIKQDGEKWKYYSEDHMACCAASVASKSANLSSKADGNLDITLFFSCF
jgi:hypothetical protein